MGQQVVSVLQGMCSSIPSVMQHGHQAHRASRCDARSHSGTLMTTLPNCTPHGHAQGDMTLCVSTITTQTVPTTCRGSINFICTPPRAIQKLLEPQHALLQEFARTRPN